MLMTFFEKIFDMSLIGCYAVLVVLAVRLLLHRCERKYSFFLWFAVFLNLCLPFTISGPFSLVPDTDIVSELQDREEDSIYEESVMTGNTQESTIDNTLNTTSDKDVKYDPADVYQNDSATEYANGYELSWQKIGSLVWILVLAVIWSICTVKTIRFMKRFGKSYGEEDTLGDSIVYLTGIDSPFILGLWNPVIYLPSNMEEEERDYILAHESFHKKRLDYITKPVFFLIATIHWFNPLVWLAYVLFVRDMEISCDEAVLSHTRRDIKKQYANSLLKYAAKQNGYVLLPLTFGEPSLKSRITNVLHYKKKSVWLSFFAICLVIVVTLGLIWRTGSAGNTDPEAEQIQRIQEAASNAYENRLDELRTKGLVNSDSAEADYAQNAFLSSEGLLLHHLKERNQVEFNKTIYSEGLYCTFIHVAGTEQAQVQLSSDTMEIQNEIVTSTLDEHSCFWKLMDMSEGEYSFTASSLSDELSYIYANIVLVQKLEELPSTLESNVTSTYLCTIPEEITVNYTFHREGTGTYGPIATFYHVEDPDWMGVIDIEEKNKLSKEIKGSITLPAGDVILRFHTSDWSMEFE